MARIRGGGGGGENSPKRFRTNTTFGIPDEYNGLEKYKFVGNIIIYIATIEQYRERLLEFLA